MKLFLFRSVIFLTVALAFVQSFGQTVTIRGSFEKPTEADVMTVYKPVNGNFNIFYADSTDETIVENGAFNVSLPLGKSGFFRIQSKSTPKTYFYAEPNDTVTVSFMEINTTSETRPVYTGNNASANNLIAEKKLFNNGQASQGVFSFIISDAKSANEAMTRISREVEVPVQSIRQFHTENRITKNSADAFVVEIEQKALAWCSDFVSVCLNEQSNQKTALKMNRVELRSLIAKLYTVYDPYLAKNRIATTNYSNCHHKAQFVMNKVIAGITPQKRPWQKFDNRLGLVVSKLSALDFAPPDVQEFFIGQSLLTALAYNSVQRNDYQEIVGVYTKLFPRSAYLPMLNKHLKIKQQSVPTSDLVRYGMYRKEAGSSTLAEQNFQGIDTVATLQSLVKHYFKGKPVFIDFWASWCSPCIAEFKHADALHAFLSDKNIATLYISIDKAEARGMWEKMANRFAISGYHYLANPQLYKNLNQWFQAIPRYMLFDATGKLLDDDLPRPSTQKELHSKIEGLISTK